MGAEMDELYGAGKWHCDDIADNPETPAVLRDWINHNRAPAVEKYEAEEQLRKEGRHPPALYADHCGQRVQVVMASRYGDVGITTRIARNSSYAARVVLPQLSNFGAKP